VVRLGRVELVSPDVLIGMVWDAAGGFHFPADGVGGRSGDLAMPRPRTRVAKPARAAKPKGDRRAKSTEKTGKKPVRSKKAVRQAGAALPKTPVDAGDAPGQAHG
jgi:hypothetical protein